jgi:PAS domain S-box-containing protein
MKVSQNPARKASWKFIIPVSKRQSVVAYEPRLRHCVSNQREKAFRMRSKSNQVALGVALAYCLISGAWIFFSDRILAALISDPGRITQIQTYKGWVFVGATGALLYITLNFFLRRWEQAAIKRNETETVIQERLRLEEQLSKLALTAPGVIHAYRQRPDGTSCFPYANPNIEKIYGFKPKDLVNDATAALKLIYPDDLGRIKASIEKSAGNMSLWRQEFRVCHPQRGEIWVEGCSSPIREPDGSILWQGFLLDITERKRAVETIAHERQLLRTLIDLLPETFYIKDLEGRFLVANEALAKHFGKKTSSDIIGLSDADFFPAEIAAQYRAAELKVLGGEPLIDHEGKGVSLNGRECTHLTTKVPFRDSEGKIRGLVGIGRDITDRKQADEALARERNLLRMMFDLLPDYIYLKDEQSRFIVCNNRRSDSDAVPITTEELIGKTDADFFPPEQAAQFRADEVVVLGGTPIIDKEETLVRPDGSQQVVLTTKLPFRDSSGKIVGLLGYGRDITERRKLEGQLRQSQKMDAIGQLSGGVAHDFNNILTVIQGNASLLLNAQLKPEEKSECLMQIIRVTERAADLTRQLLMFSRKQVMQPVNINLNDVVAQMTKMLQRILGEDIALQSNYAPNLPSIHADPGMIEQVLLNLVVNARDAMPGGGRLAISTGTEMVDGKQARQNPDAKSGLHVWVTVTDTGCGIASEILPRIFEPFFTTKEVGKGTGLGLATVYGIIQQHHGWVTVTSEINKSTTFRIYFPALDKAAVPKKSAPVIPQFARGTETILVVEDELPVRLLVKNLLQRCGYTVLQAESGVAALKIWQEHKDKIQLVLTDIIMPDNMTGPELTRQLQADKPDLKIIYTSGYSGEDAAKGIELLEGVNFLKKPYHPEKLARLLRNILDARQPAA